MSALVLNDAREYIFPLFLVRSEGDGVYLESREFLGTAFFVTKHGDAITANHVLPKPDELQPSEKVVAIVQRGEKEIVCWINHFASFEKEDLALVHVNLEDTKFLSVSDRDIHMGEDVQVIGIPSHEVHLSGKEMRSLKSHITLSGSKLELNIEIPKGMSGSPVFLGKDVVACATGSHKSEEVDDYSEEIEVVSNNKEQIRITKVTNVTHYGSAYPFSKLRGHTPSVLDGKSLLEFIDDRNVCP